MNRLALVLVAVVVLAGVPAPAATATDASAPTYVTGDVNEDTTWSADDGPYFVTDDVTVARGATLTVEPGTTVNVGGEVTLTVRGSLHAAGTAASPVAFTTAKPNPGPGTWDAIRYEGGADSTLRLANTTVEYGVTGVEVASSQGRVVVDDATIRAHVRTGVETVGVDAVPSIRVTDSRFADIGYAGVLVRAAGTNPYVESARGVAVRDTAFERTGRHGVAVWARQIRGVAVAGGSVTGVAESGVVLDTSRAATQPSAATDRGLSNVAVRGVSVTGVGGDGVHVTGGELDDVAVSGNQIRDVDGAGVNVSRALDVDDSRIAGNVVENARTGVSVAVSKPSGALQDFSLTVADNELRGNDRDGLRVTTAYVLADEFAVTGNELADNGRHGAYVATPVFDETVVADNVVRENGASGVVLTGSRVRDVTAADNRFVANDGDGLDVWASGEMSGVRVTGNDAFDNAHVGVSLDHHATGARAVTVDNNTIAGNRYGVRYAGPTAVSASNNTVAFNTRSGRDGSVADVGPSTGVVFEDVSANVTFRDNDVYGHVVGLRSESDGSVVAEDNYWGAESGPFHATLNPDGDGNAVEPARGKAAVVPFDESPHRDLLERPTVALAANRTTVAPGNAVAFSAAESSDDAGVESYHFVVDGTQLPARETPTLVEAFETNGTHEVRVVVEDAQGVESARAARVEVTVDPNRTESDTGDETTTPDDGDGNATTTTTTTAPTTQAPAQSGGGGPGLLGGLFSVWGLLGLLVYVVALAVGGYATNEVLNGRRPPVKGRFIHVIAGVAVGIWLLGSVLGPGSLLLVGAGGAGVWAAATGALFVLATR
ncbi:right-handed parallel beta-helix repeat-containing protein [Halobacterium litoreum]|uniref:Right-handed parallel beta-helix repeat-containing protein n=1 Tax=Halobacterium litoreum TaxID=2039234 RepID=A0ABD5NBB8_9EURY|nr:right-handed parallel beta-helix repeat-containing protein [Halobacterium litoreum]UHH14552.1 right-handed parallel beta-helix repeat-containing protein [Halobacterium litoreum]